MADMTNKKLRVNAISGLNCRKKPSTEGERITGFSNGTIVEVLNDENPDWYKVKSGNVTGYCASKYLGPITDDTRAKVNQSQAINECIK